MNIVVAPDSFKESLSAKAVACNIATAITKIMPDANILQVPISDGGEGLLEALVTPSEGKLISLNVKDPLLRNIQANYGILGNGTTAVVEMATASGLELLKESERNPLITSTYGTGQLIRDALNKGCTKIIIGLGGSATNDGGMGMIKALGGKFLNKKGESIDEGGGVLDSLNQIDITELDKRLLKCEIIGACDVSNPLTGKHGASFVYGGQKGGNTLELKQLDKNLFHYASIIKSDLRKDVKAVEGTGAAGGMGIALLAFFDAKLMRGIDLIIDALQLEAYIKNADLVVTGEGKIDRQTLYGKTITGVAKIAQKHGIPVIAIAGKIGNDIDEIYKLGVTSIFSIVDQPMDLQESMSKVDYLIQSCVMNIFRIIKVHKSDEDNANSQQRI
jgi:glycerate kinase